MIYYWSIEIYVVVYVGDVGVAKLLMRHRLMINSTDAAELHPLFLW